MRRNSVPLIYSDSVNSINSDSGKVIYRDTVNFIYLAPRSGYPNAQ